ncbi:MAG: AAA family ATPase [Muribaculaceae bacterium]|nr:AAA family ATPase [Muribaculaceae bacterium]
MTFDIKEILTSLGTENKIALSLLSKWEAIREEDISVTEFLSIAAHNPLPGGETSDAQSQSYPNQWVNKDMRILSLRLEGFRGIPDADEKSKVCYGLSMHPKMKWYQKATPFSMILLGSNGSGKTSLYSAIELLCLGSTSVAEKHKIKEEDIEKFYHHLSQDNKPMKITVRFNDNPSHTVSKKEDFNKIRDHLDLSAFFCSESDISIFECSGDSITDYLDAQIGLAELKKLKKFIEDIFEELDRQEDSPESTAGISEESYQELTEIKGKIDEEFDIIRSEVLTEAQYILSKLLKDYTDDVVGLSHTILQNTPNKPLFNGMLKVKATDIEIDPRNYLNNFRFKLYLISIRIAIAFHIMKTRSISFPLMFDDVFDSSDFSNRISTKEFFGKIADLYAELEISDTPLQMIFFTQDEVIAESVFDGMSFDKEGQPRDSDVMFVRLYSVFPYQDNVDKKDIQTENGVNYYNLYDEISIHVRNG